MSARWALQDIIDGLGVITRRRGSPITQGDIQVIEQAIAELYGTRPEAVYTKADLELFTARAAQAAIEAALQAIDDEPEVPGHMPDEMWAQINGDRDAVEEAIRIGVRQTKSGIRERLLSHEPQNDERKP